MGGECLEEYYNGSQWVGESEEDQGKDGLRTLRKTSRWWEWEGGENWVRKGQNGRKSPRRLKPIVGCNANIRRRRRRRRTTLNSDVFRQLPLCHANIEVWIKLSSLVCPLPYFFQISLHYCNTQTAGQLLWQICTHTAAPVKQVPFG